MNTIRALVPALIAMALAGCANPLPWTAQTPEELLSSNVRSMPFCARGELEEVQKRVYVYLQRCHRSVGVAGPVAGPGGTTLYPTYQENWTVEHRPSAGGGEEYFVRSNHGYVLGVRVKPEKECQASVTSYVKVASKRFELVNAAARGESAECVPR